MLFPKYRIGYVAPELTYVNGAPEEHSTLSAHAQTLTQTQDARTRTIVSIVRKHIWAWAITAILPNPL